ncbi:MAG: hypothetical protein IKR11_00830 [Solobacterium sp.]|nr:hypothetical protein [Solobacterium sp.]
MTAARNLENGMIIRKEKSYYEVIDPKYIKLNNGLAFVQTELKNLFDHGIVKAELTPSEEYEEILPEKKDMMYLYLKENQYYFQDIHTDEIMTVSAPVAQKAMKYIGQNAIVKVCFVDDQAFDIELPDHIDVIVHEVHPKDNVYQEAILDNGAGILVPVFVEKEDVIRMNPKTGEYLYRIKKSMKDV